MRKRLYVGGLPSATTERELQSAFAPWGGSGTMIPTDEFRQPKRFGFIEVADDQMDAAITAMNGKALRGRLLSVCEAHWRADHGGYGPAPGGHFTGGRGGYGSGGTGGGGPGDGG